jgi:uncharacterized membrane protein
MTYGYSNSLGTGYENLFACIIGLIFLIMIIGVIVKVGTQKNKLTRSGIISLLDILKNRYAEGEISKTEFEESKRDLK